jgi:hypothetical protein
VALVSAGVGVSALVPDELICPDGLRLHYGLTSDRSPLFAELGAQSSAQGISRSGSAYAVKGCVRPRRIPDSGVGDHCPIAKHAGS